MSYNDAPGWYLDTVISGLDPELYYTFVGTADRNGGESYADRVTLWRIIGADSFSYAASVGAQKIDEDAVEFSTGWNTGGYVAKWTNIQPGSDGTFTIRTSHSVGEDVGGIPGAHAYKGYAAGVFKLSAESQIDWIVYNDSIDTDPDGNPANVTNYGLGRGYSGAGETGNLVDLQTGEDIGVTVTYAETFSQGNTINWAGNAAEFIDGTDAAMEYGGILNLSGNMSYNDAPGWYLDTLFSGLDPALRYTYVGTADRNGGESYADRVTLWRIIDADSFSYAASEGAQKIDDDAVEFSTGWNTGGYVAKWTNINPGIDGTFTIRTSHSVGEDAGGVPGAHAYKGYAAGVFKLSARSGGDVVNDDFSLEVFRLTPNAGAENTHPNTPVSTVIRHRTQKVKADSVELMLDGVQVFPSVTVKADQTLVNYFPDTLFDSGSSHSVTLIFEDDATPAKSIEESWSFQVVNYDDEFLYPRIPANLAMPTESMNLETAQRGLAVRVAAPDPGSGLDAGSLDAALSIWDTPFNNSIDESSFNSLGYFIEQETINYQTQGEPRGNKANERLFPGIGFGNEQGVGFAMEATGLLHLQPGYYFFNLILGTEYELFIGTGANEIQLPRTYTPCNNCGGEDGPWFTNFLIETEGLYPFRLVYFNESGQGSLEWLEVSPGGSRHLINADHPDAIAVYAPFNTLPTPLQITEVSFPSDRIELEFLTPDSTKVHSILLSEGLANAAWTEVADVAFSSAGNNALKAVFNSPGNATGFLQVALIPPAPVYFEDFESGASGWTTENPGGSSTEWELGAPIDGPQVAYSGQNVYGTDLDGDYAFVTDTLLRSPVIDLAGVGSATLAFWDYRNIEPFAGEFFDGGQISLLDEAGNRLGDPILTKAGTTVNGWKEDRVKIPAEATGRKIRLEFRLYSDDFQPDDLPLDGWYIDNVSIIPD